MAFEDSSKVVYLLFNSTINRILSITLLTGFLNSANLDPHIGFCRWCGGAALQVMSECPSVARLVQFQTILGKKSLSRYRPSTAGPAALPTTYLCLVMGNTPKMLLLKKSNKGFIHNCFISIYMLQTVIFSDNSENPNSF